MSKISQMQHELLKETVEYCTLLDERRKKAYQEFLDCCFDFDNEVRYLKKLENETCGMGNPRFIP